MKADLKTSTRYSQALFDALNPSSYDAALEVLKELANTFDQSPELTAAMTNPGVSVAARKNIIQDLCKSVKVSEVKLENFMMILFDNSRLNCLSQIAKSFAKLVENYKKLLALSVTSAREVSEQEKKSILENISKEFGSTADIEWKVNPALIGGYVLQAGDRILNCSVDGALEQIKNVLIK